MKPEQKIRVEEILTDDLLFGRMIAGELDNSSDINPKDLQRAKEIYHHFKQGQYYYSDKEQERLKSIISNSIHRNQRKRRFMVFSAVAAVTLVFLLGGAITYNYLVQYEEPSIASYAETIRHIEPSKNTRLIMQEGEEVVISNKESKVRYNQNGESILIDSQKKVIQDMTSAKTVFHTMIVPYGKRSMVQLSDGTIVWLNSGSKFTYPIPFGEKKREVYLEGEAVFEVSKRENHPFFVDTKGLSVKVLGTVFNISAYDDEFISTVLESGSLEIHYNNKSIMGSKKLIITPGTQALYNPESQEISKRQVDPKNFTCWKNGLFIFDRTKLSEILKKIGRYYNVEIIVGNERIKDVTFSGYLDLDNTALQVLEVIRETSKFEIEEVENTFRIY